MTEAATTFSDGTVFGSEKAAASADRALPGGERQERPTLAQLLGETMEECSLGQPSIMVASKKPSAHMNNLYDERLEELRGLGTLISQCAKVAGFAGGGGLYNPRVELASRVKAGDFDEMSCEEFDVLADAANDVGQLWEYEKSAQGFPLTCNAIMREVLEDDEIFAEVFRRAHSRVTKCRSAIEQGLVVADGGC